MFKWANICLLLFLACSCFFVLEFISMPRCEHKGLCQLNIYYKIIYRDLISWMLFYFLTKSRFYNLQNSFGFPNNKIFIQLRFDHSNILILFCMILLLMQNKYTVLSDNFVQLVEVKISIQFTDE